MECAAHAGIPATETCSVCGKGACDRCLVWNVNDRSACQACGASADDRSRSLGTALLALVGVGYLGTLALGYIVFRARPFVGGLAAVVAIALGRVLQMVIRIPRVVRR